jgi:hypothetical protein
VKRNKQKFEFQPAAHKPKGRSGKGKVKTRARHRKRY